MDNYQKSKKPQGLNPTAPQGYQKPEDPTQNPWNLQAPDLSDIIANRERGLGGYSAPENEALRSQMATALNGQSQMAQRQLAAMQAKQGIHGGNAANQQSRLAMQMMQQRNLGEQDLFIKNIAEKQQRLKEFEDLKKSQQYGNLASQLGSKQLQMADLASQRELQGNEATAAAMKTAAQNSSCCFIFLEARYGNGTMDKVVRRGRDENLTPRNRRGYYKLSEVLVPLMRKYKPIKWAVRAFMTDPIVAYGKAYYGEGSQLGRIFKPVVYFWLGLFDYLGGDHPFIRENGEVV